MQNGMVFFSSPLKYNCFQKVKCNGWTWHFVCGMFWLDWFGMLRMNQVHHDIMENYSKPCLNSTSGN
jgi:hypothetical protein